MFIQCLNSEILDIEYRNIETMKCLSLLLMVQHNVHYSTKEYRNIFNSWIVKYSTIVEYSNNQLMRIEILRQWDVFPGC